jgi:hypothetical protein
MAQGRGGGNGRPKQPAAAAAAGAPTISATTPIVTAVFPTAQFGSWLDDASTPAAGSGYTGIGFGYWRGYGVSQIDVPVLSVSYGVTNRAQLGATVPFYRVSYAGTTARGLDDVYINGKVSVVDPAANDAGFGLAVGSVVEILSAGSPGMSRVQWALPVSLEVRGDRLRGYGSAGYFSRGAVFTAAALEWTAGTGTSVTGSLARSISTVDSATIGLSPAPGQTLTDVTLFLGHPVARAVSVYTGAGETFAADGRSFTFSGGVSVRFAARPSTP